MASGSARKTWLSHSGIELLERCPRCFWLQYNKKIYQPEGIVSRLANRFDGVIKKYFDTYRKRNLLPPMIEGKVEGKLQNPFQQEYFYDYNDKYGFYGKLDECLVRTEGTHTPLDHKTSSSDPRQKETLPAYQAQLDAYAFLLEANNKPTSGFGHLLYFYPDLSESLHDGFPMVVHIETLQTDPFRAQERIKKAVEVLERTMPERSERCVFCAWRESVNTLLYEQ